MVPDDICIVPVGLAQGVQGNDFRGNDFRVDDYQVGDYQVGA